MEKGFWEKRIPTIIAIFVLIIAIFIIFYLINKGVIIVGKASVGSTPQNIKITNITDNSFSVTFLTLEKTTGFISFGETENLGNIIRDDRDKSNKNQGSYYSHHITVSNLKPKTKYYFSIISSNRTFLDNNKKFTISTAGQINFQNEQNFIQGKIILPNGSKAEDAIVYIYSSSPSSQIISSLTNNSGEYIIPIHNIRNSYLDNSVVFSDENIIYVEVIRSGIKSNVKLPYKMKDNIPTITLSKDYDFTSSIDYQNLSDLNLSSDLKVSTPSASSSEVKIISPQKDDLLKDLKPVFKGTAPKGVKVKIIINSENKVEGEVIADNNGFWTFKPNTPLSPGKHTITIETTDSYGIIRRINQSFTIEAQIIQSPTPTLTPKVTLKPTITKTTTITVTPKPTITPTLEPTSTVTPTFSVTQPLPTIEAPGNTSLTISFTFIIFIIITTAIIFLVL